MGRPRKLPDGMVQRPGRKGYYADFRVRSQRIQKKLGTDFEVAKSILHELRARAEKSEYNLLDNNYLVEDLKKQYLAHCRQSLEPSTVGCYEDWLNSILPALAVTKISQITIPGVLTYREKRLAQGRSPRTVNGEVGALNTMLNWAVDSPRLIGTNPIARLKPLPHLKPKQGRPLTDEEVLRLLEESPPYWRNIWYAFLVTGLRKSELAGLQFTAEFLDWEAREIIIPAWLAKSGVQRRIPMDDRLYAILRRLEEERDKRHPGKGRGPISAAKVQARFTRDHVFVTKENTPLDHKGNLWRAFARCLQKAKIDRQTFGPDGRLLEHVDIHSLRRTFATSLIVGGADPKTVQELLGHKTLTMTMKIYAKVRPQTKRQVVAGLSYGANSTAAVGVFPLQNQQTKSVQDGDLMPATAKDETQAIAGYGLVR